MSDPMTKLPHVQKKDLGMVGLVLLITQIVTDHSSGDRIERLSHEISAFKDDFHKSLLEREISFAKKTDILEVTRRLEHIDMKIDRIAEKQSRKKIEKASLTLDDAFDFWEDDLSSEDM